MNALTIARRDIASYLQGYSAYLIMAALLFFNGLAFHAWALQGARYSSDVLRDCFELCWGFAVATAVLLTMRSVADEHAHGTEVLLRTSVVSDLDIVLGKWLAGFGMVALYVSLTVHMPLLIFVHGKVSVGHLLVGYLGVLMGGAVAAALGVFCSALFRNQLAAGVIAGVLAIFLSIFTWRMADIVDAPFSEVLSYVAIFNQHTAPLLEGRLPLSSLVFHFTLGGLLIWLSTLVLNGRRWE
ncbi:MAG: ABC transporter permease [Bryobacterales bacterium]